MRTRYSIGLAFTIGLFVLAFSNTSSSSDLNPYIDCLVHSGTEGVHGVKLTGDLGFDDFPRNPTNLEVDWDDGAWSSVDNYDDNYSVDFHHVYGTGGLRHIKFYVDDSVGNTCDDGYPVVFDVTVQ